MSRYVINILASRDSTISLTTLLKTAWKQAIAFFVPSTASVNNSLLSPKVVKAMQPSVLTFEDCPSKAMLFSTGFWTMELKF
jgi:hypothetical protein